MPVAAQTEKHRGRRNKCQDDAKDSSRDSGQECVTLNEKIRQVETEIQDMKFVAFGMSTDVMSRNVNLESECARRWRRHIKF